MLKNILLVGFGGFLGSVLRYGVSLFATHNLAPKSLFPWGTFIVNIIGCLIIGVLWGILDTYDWLSDELRLFLMVGFCGGFTTFSSYALDGHIVGKENVVLSLIYLTISLIIGMLFVYAGYSLVRILE